MAYDGSTSSSDGEISRPLATSRPVKKRAADIAGWMIVAVGLVFVLVGIVGFAASAEDRTATPGVHRWSGAPGWRSSFGGFMAPGELASRDTVNIAIEGATSMTRGERLCKGELKVLYHQTDRRSCEAILENGFDMARAKFGNLGAGTYFADSAAVTNYKTRHHGCVIKVLVRLGNVMDLGNAWLQDVGRKHDTCEPLLGYKMSGVGGEGYDSISTDKHGRERSIFFLDQIVDMVAYYTSSNHFVGWFQHQTSSHTYVNGRSEFQYPETCDADEYKTFDPPICTTPKPSTYACKDQFKHAACAVDYRGNVAGSLQCVGVWPSTSMHVASFKECENTCAGEAACRAVEYLGGSRTCHILDRVPSTRSVDFDAECVKKVA